MQAFKELGISEPILKSLEEHGFERPSEIQEKTIKLVIEGKDIIAGASTGSGKTLAFGSGILQNTKKNYGIQALILTPTRELADQIVLALNKFSNYNPLKIAAIYGGVSINPQFKQLEYADVIVGTPGRILDHINRNSIDLSNIKTLVLDEADRMLDMGFRDDVEKIINKCPNNRQTLLFSATISQDVVLLSKKYMKEPIEISAKPQVDPIKLKQIYYDVIAGLKYSLLMHLLKNEKANLIMVFCNTRMNADFVANNLKLMGIDALLIHGGFAQDKRSRILEQFHSNKANILVCTDVAARGLDIKGVSHIYNYDIPNESNEYVHRIGRTARAGKEGIVINLISSRDYDNFRGVLDLDNINIKQEETPYVKKVGIKWIPQRKNRFSDRRGNGNNNYNNRGGSSRGGSYTNRRGNDNYRNKSGDNRNNSNGYRGGDNERRSGSYDNRKNDNDRSRYSGNKGYGNRERDNDKREYSGNRSYDKRSEDKNKRRYSGNNSYNNRNVDKKRSDTGNNRYNNNREDNKRRGNTNNNREDSKRRDNTNNNREDSKRRDNTNNNYRRDRGTKKYSRR